MLGNKKENPPNPEKEVNLKDLPKPNAHKFSKKMKMIVGLVSVILIILVVIIFGIILSGGNRVEVAEEVPETEVAEEVLEGLPQKNTLYFGNYKGEEVIFIKNILGFTYVSNDPYFGYTYYATGSAKVNSFKDLENSVKLIDFGEKVKGDLFRLNKNKSKLYINISKVGDREYEYPNIDNFLYQIDVETQENRVIWENALGSGKYEGGNGTAYVSEVIDDSYVIMDVLSCYGCVPKYAGNIIVNVSTGEDKYVKNARILDVNEGNGTFTYQNYGIVLEDCGEEDRSDCNRKNQREVEKLTGEIFSEELP